MLKKQHGNIKGIGATPEAIEQVPVLYDALFELAWRNEAPNAAEWLADYATARYGQPNADAQAAWGKGAQFSAQLRNGVAGTARGGALRTSGARNRQCVELGRYGHFLQSAGYGRCGFPAAEGAKRFEKKPELQLRPTDFTRQAPTDYGYFLLKAVKAAYDSHDQAQYARCRDAYLQLVLDVDELLCTNPNFMLGRWTQMARGIADEAKGHNGGRPRMAGTEQCAYAHYNLGVTAMQANGAVCATIPTANGAA